MAATARLSRRLCAAALAAAAGGAVLLYQPALSANDLNGGSQLSLIRQRISDLNAAVPCRAVQESALIGSSSVNPLDVLVIGGGATGCGVALDAVTRGLRVGLVEREDFSSGTSSRSTKLIHGGM
jgi:glycerol-3-phosphate dehydrogenase